MWRATCCSQAAAGDVAFGIGHHPIAQRFPVRFGRRCTEEALVDVGKDRGILIGGAAEHDAIDMVEMNGGLVERADATIDADENVGPALFHPVDDLVVERRYLAIFLGAQALQPGLARMDPDRVGA